MSCLDIHNEGKAIIMEKVKLACPEIENNIELKVEANNKYNNLFIESWSDKNKQVPGWFYTTNFDFLFYAFLKQRQLFIIGISDLKRAMSIRTFKEKEQNKYKQSNNTYGFCVPIDYLKENGGKMITF